MQKYFDLFYLYDYMVAHTIDEEQQMFIHLRDYVLAFIREYGEV